MRRGSLSRKETNLAPKGSPWQEERLRLINSENFGESAASLIQMGITNSSPKLTKKTQKTELDQEIRAIRKQRKKLQKQLLKDEQAQTLTKQTKKKQKTELDLEIRAIRKQKRKLLNQLLKDELAQITDDEKPPKKRKKKTNDDLADKHSVTAVKEELKSKEDPSNISTNAEEDPKQTNQTEEYFEYVESWQKKEPKPSASVEDDITDTKQEEVESQIDTQKRATRETFKLEIQQIGDTKFEESTVNPFLDLYLNWAEAHSKSPSADEADEVLIQVPWSKMCSNTFV